MSKPVVIASFSFPHEAQLARVSLETAGIPAIVADEHTINMQWLYSNALGGVKVLVQPEHANEARDILNSDFSQEVENEFEQNKPSCPSCGSINLESYTNGKKLAFLISLFWASHCFSTSMD